MFSLKEAYDSQFQDFPTLGNNITHISALAGFLKLTLFRLRISADT